MKIPIAKLMLFSGLAMLASTLSAASARNGEPTREALWPNGAPEAKGDDPEKDVPAITIYKPEQGCGTAVVVCPGGGYGGLALGHEGRDIAKWLNAAGITAVVLEYRMSRGGYRHPVPLMDAQRAVRTVRSRSKELGVDPARIGIMGFSAGGHLASTLGTHFDSGNPDAADPINRVGCRPDFMILCYPVIAFGEPHTHRGSQRNLIGEDPPEALVRELSNEKQVTRETPPTFLFHTEEDQSVPVENSIAFYAALKKAGVPAELKVYPKGHHGIGLAGEIEGAREWPDACLNWLRKFGYAEAQEETKATLPEPTLSNVRYGDHERNVLDFWRAESDGPTPVIFHMHGGGWYNGDKESVGKTPVQEYLDAGISVVSINYRYIKQARREGIEPPVKGPMMDAARALQFVRFKADEWNLDPERTGVSGNSAGACTTLWLALHDDLADPDSDDPVARESTRVWCAAVEGAQTSLDPKQMREWTPNSRYGGHAFDVNKGSNNEERFAYFLEHRAEVLPWIKEFSPIEHASAGDPPIYLIYGNRPALGERQKDPTHSANFGVKLKDRLDAVGVDCELVYPGASDVGHATRAAYLIAMLKANPSSDAPEQ